MKIFPLALHPVSVTLPTRMKLRTLSGTFKVCVVKIYMSMSMCMREHVRVRALY